MALAQLILLPGLACDAEMWRAQLAVLPAGLSPVVSDAHTRHTTIAAMAQAVLDEHAGPLLLCGASMGGMVAMQAAHLAGARVAGLALVGTSARPEAPPARHLREQMLALLADGRTAEVLRANVPFALAPPSSRDATLATRYLAMLHRAGTAQLVQQNRAAMDRPDLRPLLPALRCRTLVLCGELDRLAPPAHAREIAEAIPGAALQLLPGCGHMPTMEAPQAVNTALLAWLASADHRELPPRLSPGPGS